MGKGRPSTAPKKLRDGFYVEIFNKTGGTGGGIKIRRDSKEEMMEAAREYEKTKRVVILGESKNGKWVKEK